MLKRRGLASLLCVVLIGAGVWPSHAFAATDDQDDRAGFKLISEGLGIKGVYVWRSTESDVIEAYGKDYDLIKHGWYTYEIRYVLLDLSFYYCQNDPQKRIFDIECRTGFAGFTANGIVLGESTVRDVFKAYGVSPDRESFPNNSGVVFERPGIQFSVEEPDRESPVSIYRLLDRKIKVIDIVTSKPGSDCLPPNLK
jgi:hypothetical protein